MSDLPAGWTETTLGEIASQGQYGWTSKAADNGQVKYLRTTDITSGQIDWDTVPFCQDNPPDVDKYKIALGDILISRAGSVGFSALIQDVPSTPAVFASYLIRYIPKPEVNSKYLAHFLKSPSYWQQISDAAAGIALANVNAKKLANVVLPLAPLDEQKRIAEKLDSLLTRVDSCERHLERVPQILKRFRQSVLAAATSGRLTEDWRNERGISIEDWDTKTGKDIFPFITSGSRWWAKYYSDSGSIFIRVGNLDHDTIELDLSNIQYVTPPDDAESKRTRVQVGDILISITADVGMVGYVRKDIGDAYTNQHVCIARQTGEYNGEYLAYYLTSPVGGLGQLTKAQRGATKAGLTLGDIRELIIQIPSPEEQAEIVRRVESLFAYAERLEARYLSASGRVARLTPSLLEKAFRGELVEQDPNDEPASALPG